MSDANWSAPEHAVVRRVRAALDRSEPAVLATVVAVEGSAYRRPGAKMVIPEGEGAVGQVTAGCLEDEIEGLAADVLATGEPRVVRYDLRTDAGDDAWGLGVGCNGVVTVLLEPVDSSYRPVVDAVAAGDDVGVLTVVEADDGDAEVGARAYYDPEARAVSGDEQFPATLADRLDDVAAALTSRGRADSVEIGGTTVFVDGVAAPDDLVVIGTGADVRPVVEFGSRAGFRVTVVGFRGASATPERFPAADDVRSTSPASVREAVAVDQDTYVVVATHNFVDDRIAVGELLETPAPYVGLLGPRERFEEMLEEFEAAGRDLPDAALERLYTPVGLDLGGGSPDQIALSVVSEVLAVSNDRRPRHLSERDGPIHERLELADRPDEEP